MADRDILRDVIQLGGLALQGEDVRLRTASYLSGKRGGLAHIQNERMHQFAIWSSVMPLYDARIEAGLIDLTINYENSTHLFEMKNWRDEGTSQIDSIRRDARKLRSLNNSKGYIIVTSMNPPELTDRNLAFLEEEVSEFYLSTGYVFRFLSEDKCGRPLEGWVGGWPLFENIVA